MSKSKYNRNKLKNEKIKKHNSSIKSTIKNIIKKIKFYIFNKKYNLAKSYFIYFQSFIDRQSRKNIISKNKSRRLKSKLIKKINLINY